MKPTTLATSAAVAATAAVGTAGTDVTSRWYRRLDKPRWQPPGPVFGIAWSALYVLLATAGARAVTTVRVDPGGVTVTRADRTTTAGREEVAAVFCDGRDLVLLRPDGGEAARERTWHRAARLRRAFSAEGWPWRDGDPYAAEYSRWVEGLPDVGAREEALLRARHAALRSGDAADASALREELGRLGVVVRDEGRRQYWRRVHAVGD